MFENIKTTYEVAIILNLTQEHVAWLCRRGDFIGAIKKGKTWLIPETSIKAYSFTHGNKRQREKIATQKQED